MRPAPAHWPPNAPLRLACGILLRAVLAAILLLAWLKNRVTEKPPAP